MSYKKGFTEYGHWGDNKIVYTPDIEVFIEHWQKAKCQRGARKSLIEALEKARTPEDGGSRLLVAECESLKNRADNWRWKGIPLKDLPYDSSVETEEEKIVRLSALAISSAK